MDGYKIIILGGYGKAGSTIAGLLLKHTQAHITIAGRDKSKLKETSERLNGEKYSEKRVTEKVIDITHTESLSEALSGHDLVVIAMPFKKPIEGLFSAIVKAKIDYIDINDDEKKIESLKHYENEIIKKNKTFIINCGGIPGLPLLLSRFALSHYDMVQSIEIGSVMKDEKIPYGSAYDIVNHAKHVSHKLVYGKPVESSLLNTKKIPFLEPFKKQKCFLISLDELKDIPGIESIKRTSRNFNSYITCFL